MSPCEEFAQQLPEWTLGDLDPAAAFRLEAHLQTCSACRGEAEEFRTLATGLRNESHGDPGELFFARQAKQILMQVHAESSLEEEAEGLLGALKSLPIEDPGELFFQRQFRLIQKQIQGEAAVLRAWPRPWRRALVAAAALLLFGFGLSRWVPWNSLNSSASWQTALQYLNEENETAVPSLDLDELDSRQLDLLASNLQKSVIQEDPGNLQDEDDWEDLDEPELHLLIERLQETFSRRAT